MPKGFPGIKMNIFVEVKRPGWCCCCFGARQFSSRKTMRQWSNQIHVKSALKLIFSFREYCAFTIHRVNEHFLGLKITLFFDLKNIKPCYLKGWSVEKRVLHRPKNGSSLYTGTSEHGYFSVGNKVASLIGWASSYILKDSTTTTPPKCTKLLPCLFPMCRYHSAKFMQKASLWCS